MPKKILKALLENYGDQELLIADGFDDAIIGIDRNSMRLVYSVKKILAILMKEGMTEEESIEHFEYNVEGGYVGEQTPVWCYDIFY
jgi:hypothetical protein